MQVEMQFRGDLADLQGIGGETLSSALAREIGISARRVEMKNARKLTKVSAARSGRRWAAASGERWCVVGGEW